MFRVSAQSRYGLRVMIYLARNENKISPLREISKKEKLSFVYLEKIILKLKKTGLVESQKGSQGGYFLAEKPSKIKINRIISALEGERKLVQCIAKKDKKQCFLEKKCKAKNFWLEIQNSIEKILDSTTLADLIK